VVRPLRRGVQSDSVLVLPWWLVVGVLVGLAIGVVIAAIFLVGSRLFPDDGRTRTTADGENRKTLEIRHYLRTIGEEFLEDYDLDGQPVAFYLPERDVAITFDARAYFRIAETDTYAVLVEHEMPGIHLGRRLPFETPELRPAADGDRATTAAFALLGLETDATAAEVRSAYRERVKRVHPDQGGDPETFRRVREAYATAQAHATDEEAETPSVSATS
jgi:hypothetical protein